MGKIVAVIIVIVLILAAIAAWRLLATTPATPPVIFTEATFGEPDSLDPAYDYETSGGEVIQNIAETLIWYNGASAASFKPMLATAVPDVTNPNDVSRDGLLYNLTLRAGVKFHFGTDTVDCNAVKFSITRALEINDPDGPAWIMDQSLTDYASGAGREAIIQDSVRCPDGATGLRVQFHLAKPYPAFLATLAFSVSSVIDPNPAAYTVSSRCPTPAAMYTTRCDDQLVGTGPFKLRVWTPGTEIIMDRFDGYWRPAANFKEVHILKIDDVATRVLKLKSGDADFIALSPDHDVDIRDSNGVLLPGISEYSNPTFVVQFLGLNQNINVSGAPAGDTDVPNNFFGDINVRKAFAYAWDYDGFIQNVLLGYGEKLCGPVPKGMLGYDNTIPCFSQDLTKVQQYLQAAMDPRTVNPLDSYWDNGFTITLYYNEGNLPREEGARQLKTTLEALNAMRTGLPPITIKVSQLVWATFLDYVREEIPALFFLGWAPDYADPDDYVYPFLHSGQTFTRRIGYTNTSLDTLIDSQTSDLNPTTSAATLRQIQLAD